MNPIALLAAAGVAALFFFRRPARRVGPAPGGLDADADADGGKEGTSVPPPPPPKRRPAKDFAIGGFKSAGGGGGGGGGGGLVFEPGGQAEPEPEPEPHGVVPQAVSLPAVIDWEQQLGDQNDSIEVQLSEQSNPEQRLPNGTYYAKLSLDVRMNTSLIYDNGQGTWVWNHDQIVGYSQVETITYKLTVTDNAAIVQKVKQVQKSNGVAFNRYMFNCAQASECGWNGKYFSFFEPRLVWNLGLEARFKTRHVFAPGINRYNVRIRVAFSRSP